jgi:phosphoribosylamine-glycine ligase
MMRLGSGFADALRGCALGQRPIAPSVLSNAAVSVVLASGGYPGAYRKGLPISLGAVPTGVKLFHAGTVRADGTLCTNGGRVLCATASAESPLEARRLAYQGAEAVAFDGAYFRSDIAGRLVL